MGPPAGSDFFPDALRLITLGQEAGTYTYGSGREPSFVTNTEVRGLSYSVEAKERLCLYGERPLFFRVWNPFTRSPLPQGPKDGLCFTVPNWEEAPCLLSSAHYEQSDRRTMGKTGRTHTPRVINPKFFLSLAATHHNYLLVLSQLCALDLTTWEA